MKIVLLVLFVFISSITAINPPLPCPPPEDRAKAWDSGKPCYTSYSCCFTETVDNTTHSCCYTYGSDGPYKCCGSAVDPTFIIIMSVIGGLIFSMILTVIIVEVVYRFRKKSIKPITEDDRDNELLISK